MRRIVAPASRYRNQHLRAGLRFLAPSHSAAALGRRAEAPHPGAKLSRCLMPEARFSGKTVRFGVYEADLVSGELRKNGTLIRLQEQPFQILALLLERPGELVTRDDLRSKLWSADTFVDFDHSLNTAVNKLREALGGTASNPRFVQTIARRGYRFIAPVQEARVSANVPSDPRTGEPTDPSQLLNGSPAVQGTTNAPSASLNQDATKADKAAVEVLHPELEVPIPRRGLTRGLFLLIQAMYLIFYVEGLVHLQSAYRIADGFFPEWGASG